MILEIQVKDPARAACGWWPKVKALEGIKKFTFQPKGLTILWGPNGSGKSTILKTMARLTHCEQGGTPKVTQSSVWEIQDGHLSRNDGPLSRNWRDGVALVHDGQPVHFLDPSHDPGLMGGAFDDDFFSSGMTSIQLKNVSAGQRIMAKFSQITESAVRLEAVEWAMNRKTVNDVWRGNLAKVGEMLAPTDGVEPGARTILLDEPERSISIPKQAEFWGMIRPQRRFQLIIATHSVFALDVEGAEYIDLEPGYLDECRRAVAGVRTLPAGEPKKRAEPPARRDLTDGEKKVLRFKCPHCQARPWKWCTQPSGAWTFLHAKRHRKAFPDVKP